MTPLQQARQDAGLSRAELADAADISLAYVAKLEAAQSVPTLTVPWSE